LRHDNQRWVLGFRFVLTQLYEARW